VLHGVSKWEHAARFTWSLISKDRTPYHRKLYQHPLALLIVSKFHLWSKERSLRYEKEWVPNTALYFRTESKDGCLVECCNSSIRNER